MREKRERKISLDEDPFLFRHFVTFLYHNSDSPWQLSSTKESEPNAKSQLTPLGKSLQSMNIIASTGGTFGPSPSGNSFSGSSFYGSGSNFARPSVPHDPSKISFGSPVTNVKASLESTTAPSICILLVRLYTLGDRLQAHRFKHAVLADFNKSLLSSTLSERSVCRLLEIVVSDIPDFVQDPLRSQVLWHAASQLDKLQAYEDFDKLLVKLPDLGRWLCRWAGNTTMQRPALPQQATAAEGGKFVPESVQGD